LSFQITPQITRTFVIPPVASDFFARGGPFEHLPQALQISGVDLLVLQNVQD
jgi:hypothetical protein